MTTQTAKSDRLYEDQWTAAGCIMGLPAWADVDVMADGERAVQGGRTDYKGRLYMAESWWDEYGGKQLDVYVRRTKSEREREN